LNLKTYPLGSKEAMKREPSLEPPSIRYKGWVFMEERKGIQGCDFTCQRGHQYCADKPDGNCWLDWLREEQFQAQMYDAMNDDYLEGES
tara:strand:- start:1306 stop:1572 length:267 start_codon:yes stop_codon:yes gene_type:complete